MQLSLVDLSTVVRSFGRGVVFRAPVWTPGTPLEFEHLGDTEGDIVINTNPEMAALTVPELTGPAAHEMDYVGEGPTIELPLYLTDPAKIALISPTGISGGGRSRRSAPTEHTLLVLPEDLFLEPDGNGVPQSYDLDLTAGVWTLDGSPLTAAQVARLAVGFWAWRCVFNTPPRTFHGAAGDGRKNIETVTATLLYHPDMPEGHHLYTTGDPTDYGIDPEGGS